MGSLTGRCQIKNKTYNPKPKLLHFKHYLLLEYPLQMSLKKKKKTPDSSRREPSKTLNLLKDDQQRRKGLWEWIPLMSISTELGKPYSKHSGTKYKSGIMMWLQEHPITGSEDVPLSMLSLVASSRVQFLKKVTVMKFTARSCFWSTTRLTKTMNHTLLHGLTNLLLKPTLLSTRIPQQMLS